MKQGREWGNEDQKLGLMRVTEEKTEPSSRLMKPSISSSRIVGGLPVSSFSSSTSSIFNPSCPSLASGPDDDDDVEGGDEERREREREGRESKGEGEEGREGEPKGGRGPPVIEDATCGCGCDIDLVGRWCDDEDDDDDEEEEGGAFEGWDKGEEGEGPEGEEGDWGLRRVFFFLFWILRVRKESLSLSLSLSRSDREDPLMKDSSSSTEQFWSVTLGLLS